MTEKLDLDVLADRYRYETGESLLRLNGFDDCVVGIVERFGQKPILCYDRAKIVAKLAANMTELEAEEFFDFNIIGAWVGEQTPCFLVDPVTEAVEPEPKP